MYNNCRQLHSSLMCQSGDRLHNRSGISFVFIVFLSPTYLHTYRHESEWAGIEPATFGCLH